MKDAWSEMNTKSPFVHAKHRLKSFSKTARRRSQSVMMSLRSQLLISSRNDSHVCGLGGFTAWSSLRAVPGIQTAGDSISRIRPDC
jgi:hypothetical protein